MARAAVRCRRYSGEPGRMRALLAAIATVVLLGLAEAPLNILYAGSLVRPMERDILPTFEQRCSCSPHGEGKGSGTIAQFMLDGIRSPDVVITADAQSMEQLLHPRAGAPLLSWYATFGTARMVMAYSKHSRFERLLQSAASGHISVRKVLRTAGLRIGRTDPRVDPKGYRAMMVMMLLGMRYNDPSLVTTLVNDNQVFPEETLLTRLESGDLDVAFLYSTELQHGRFGVIEFPRDSNLGDPRFAKQYRTVLVAVNHRVYHGSVIAYALSVPLASQNLAGAREFVHFVLYGGGRRTLEAAGLHFIRPQIIGSVTTAKKYL